MNQLEEALERLSKAQRGDYRHDRVDIFVLAIAWWTIGVLTGLILAGIIAGITY